LLLPPHLGFRLATVADQQRLTSWLAVSIAHAERRPDRVRDALLGKFRREHIEAPTVGRVQRMVRSALRTAEQTWTARVCDRLGGPARARLLALIADTSDEDTNEGEGDQDGAASAATVLGMIKSEPGNVSLESMMTEVSAVAGGGALPVEVLAERLMLAIYAYGTNTGIRAVAAGGGHAHSEEQLRYARRRYLSREAAQEVAIEIANATFAIRRQSLWGAGSTAVASDSTHFRSWDQNIFTEWHSRYGGRGILIYWHVERGPWWCTPNGCGPRPRKCTRWSRAPSGTAPP